MVEGTKLGDKQEEQDFKTFINNSHSLEGAELKGTKLGEMSEFEKNLYLEEEEIKNETTPINQETPTVENIEPQPQPEPVVKEEITSTQEMLVESKTDLNKEIAETVLDYKEGDIIKGVIRNISKSGLLVDMKYKSDGYVPNSEFTIEPEETLSNTSLKIGDVIEVHIDKLETKEGYTLLSRKKAQYELMWNFLIDSIKSKEPIQVKVSSSVEGGVVVDYKGIKGFIPASHVIKTTEEKLDSFVNQTLDVIVLQVERKRRKIIFSHKMARLKPSKINLAKTIESIEVGEVREGVVSSIKDFGAFVNISGAEGLVHISELSWARVNHPSELLRVGDRVTVFVLGVDRENNKISLGMKQLKPDPWVEVSSKYKVGQIVKGKISRIVSFGAFMQIESDLEGLIHISELSYDHVDRVESVIKVGQVVKAEIIKLIPDEQKIGLTLKGIDQSDLSQKIESPEIIEETKIESEAVITEDKEEVLAEVSSN